MAVRFASRLWVLAIWLFSLPVVAEQSAVEAPRLAEPPVTLIPFHMGTFSFVEGLDAIGPTIDLLDRALELHGFDMQMDYFPGKRLMAQLNNGLVDGDLYRSANLSRGFENVVRVDEPLGQVCSLFFSLHERADIDPQELGARIGIYSGIPAVEASVRRRWPSIELVFFKHLSQGAQMLLHHRIELVAVHTGQEEALKHLVDKPVVLDSGIVIAPGYTHLHRRHASLAKELAVTIHNLKRQASLLACNQDYLNQRLAREAR